MHKIRKIKTAKFTKKIRKVRREIKTQCDSMLKLRETPWLKKMHKVRKIKTAKTPSHEVGSLILYFLNSLAPTFILGHFILQRATKNQPEFLALHRKKKLF